MHDIKGMETQQRTLKAKTFTFRLTNSQYLKLIALGGGEFLRAQINKTRVAKESK